jgi:hypothetical protein
VQTQPVIGDDGVCYRLERRHFSRSLRGVRGPEW